MPLINIVRKEEHVHLLKSIGAQFVCNSHDDEFMDQLTSAIIKTKATLAFDATGGGELAGKILTCMEVAARKNATEYSPMDLQITNRFIFMVVLKELIQS